MKTLYKCATMLKHKNCHLQQVQITTNVKTEQPGSSSEVLLHIE